MEVTRRLNAHLVSLLESSRRSTALWMPVEVDGRGCAWGEDEPDALGDGRGGDGRMMVILKGRLSSFGFSGTITHGMFGGDREGTLVSEPAELQSSVRGKVSVYRSTQVRAGEESAAAQKLVGFHGVTPGKELASMEGACGDEGYLHCEACPRSLG